MLKQKHKKKKTPTKNPWARGEDLCLATWSEEGQFRDLRGGAEEVGRDSFNDLIYGLYPILGDDFLGLPSVVPRWMGSPSFYYREGENL